jgi:hypothetical protein
LRKIYVYGSNLLGINIPLKARQHGASIGDGKGLNGDSYSLPIAGKGCEPYSPKQIRYNVNQFIYFANQHAYHFYIEDKLRPYFIGLVVPFNVHFIRDSHASTTAKDSTKRKTNRDST